MAGTTNAAAAGGWVQRAWRRDWPLSVHFFAGVIAGKLLFLVFE